jgi:hypothetical protein
VADIQPTYPPWHGVKPEKQNGATVATLEREFLERERICNDVMRAEPPHNASRFMQNGDHMAAIDSQSKHFDSDVPVQLV